MSAASPDSPVAAETARSRILSIAAGVLLVVMAVVAIVAILFFAERDRRRDVAQWTARLNVIADSRQAAVQGWFDQNLAELRTLAENQSVQLYLTELSQAQGNRAAVTDEPAQLGYLRNLLVATAERVGFGGGRASVGANLRRTGSGGLALLDAEGKALVASPEMPPIDDAMAARLAAAPKDRPVAIDAEVFVYPTEDPGIVRGRIEEALVGFFSFDGMSFGQSVYFSDIVALLDGVRGVSHVTMFAPQADVEIKPGQIATLGEVHLDVRRAA